MLQRLGQDREGRGHTRALVLVPTRELAMQVAQAIHTYGKYLGVKVLPIYGGAPMPQQIRALDRGADVVVATPGRALDHIRRGTLRLDRLHLLVLDEADEMLDIGFAEDLDAILEAVPAGRQTALFSATVSSRIAAIAKRHLTNPVRVTIEREQVGAGRVPRVRQISYIVARAQKPATRARVLEMESPRSAIVFCRTRLEVDALGETLNAQGYRAEALHGGLTQGQRDGVMTAFRAGKVDLLLATDVAARGLDVEHLSHVVNYDVPWGAYVHRIGRTGRAEPGWRSPSWSLASIACSGTSRALRSRGSRWRQCRPWPISARGAWSWHERRSGRRSWPGHPGAPRRDDQGEERAVVRLERTGD